MVISLSVPNCGVYCLLPYTHAVVSDFSSSSYAGSIVLLLVVYVVSLLTIRLGSAMVSYPL